MQTGHLAHATLLMVDDNPKNLDLIGEIFKASGCRLLLCKSGERGLALAQQARPDLILLDVMMPGIDGYETCRQLKQNPETRDIPVLFLSALADAVNKVKGFEAGAVDFVSKPFDIAELLARVNTHLELKRAREELQAWNQALLRLQQEKDEFLDRVTHDLKNPLGNILLFSDHMANRHLSEEKSREVAGLIARSGQRMFQLIEELLEVQRLEQGKLELQPVELDPATVIEEIRAEFAARAQSKQQELLFSQESPVSSLRLDPARLHQVLDNLVSNALKFSPPQTRIELLLSQEHDQVKIRVKDQGPGLSPADQARLFTKFARLSARPTGGESSTGLGLYLAKSLASAMQGRIDCQSEAGQGSCFSLSFPTSQA